LEPHPLPLRGWKSLIGVACVKGMESLWTIFFSIISLLVPYEIFSSIG
jgi:hypothetical protein